VRSINSGGYLPEIVLIILSFEGACYLVGAFDTPRALVDSMRLSLTKVGWMIVMVVVLMSVFALMAWLLFHDITPAMLQADGVLGPDDLFSNFWVSLITLWAIAQADGTGVVTRSIDRIRPGGGVFLILFNFFLYYLVANALIATFAVIFQRHLGAVYTPLHLTAHTQPNPNPRPGPIPIPNPKTGATVGALRSNANPVGLAPPSAQAQAQARAVAHSRSNGESDKKQVGLALSTNRGTAVRTPHNAQQPQSQPQAPPRPFPQLSRTVR
jgi:hypothetical protein